jgi:glycosyltransferase involved in cell wall biosynthesis
VLVKGPEEAAESLAKVLGDKGYREAMVARGYSRAGQFDWRTTATRTAEVFESAYRESTLDGGR